MKLEVVRAIADIDAAGWDAFANPEPAHLNPFLSHAFLKALEDAACVGEGTGWLPRHLIMRDAAGGLAGIMPLYVKSHSQGEFVFDQGWADAYQRAGGRYYPKLLSAVPFTPVPGARLLVGAGKDAEARARLLAEGAIGLARRLGVSSLHVTFPDEAQWKLLASMGFLQRTGQQFHWLNRGYATFDDFLGELSSRKRKAVRKERAEAVAGAVEIDHVTGAAITERHWDAMFGFYMDTGSRKWGRPYLNRAFFSRLGEVMADRCLLVLARREGRYIAGALNLVGGDCLYGRYWGAIEHQPFLHFELCYYQAIDFAIAQGLARVEAGAQGEHKLARGYLPVPTYSAHWFADPALESAVALFLEGERRHVAHTIEVLGDYAPFRKGPRTEDA